VALELRGCTALITGASSGIGREIARVLARHVAQLVLVARRRERLEVLADELRAKPRSEPGALTVRVAPVDLLDRRVTGEMLDGLLADGVHVDILVNNAGFGDYGLFEQREFDTLERMLELNVVTATFLVHRLLPEMLRRGRGGIMNVGSSAGMLPAPGSGVYASTKAYLNHLSEALRAETAGTGVEVTSVCPGPVETEFQEVAGLGERPSMPELLHVTAERCADDAVAALVAGRARVVPGLPLRAAVLALESVPRALVRPFLRRAGRRLRDRMR